MKTLKLLTMLFFLSIFSILMANCTPQIIGSMENASTVGQSSSTSSSATNTSTPSPTPIPLNFSPTSGYVGSVLTLSGMDFTSVTGVTIGGTSATIVNHSSSSMMVMVMPGTSSGSIVATTSSGSQTFQGSYSVNATGLPINQQGSKLVGTGLSGTPIQGYGVAISADGNTVAVGAPGVVYSGVNTGAVWVFTRNGSTWTQQGSTPLVGTGYTFTGSGLEQGYSVAISADGNTILTGSYWDNNCTGASYVFTRNGSTWSQQGAKLIGSGGSAGTCQGNAVSLSADGNTALIGGSRNNSNLGAAWVFNRTGSTWTQHGNKLVGSDYIGNSFIGSSVAMSADGKTALVGGLADNAGIGASWVFALNGSTWAQQGPKLLGSGNSGTSSQGASVAISADGNAAVIGGDGDNSTEGAIWIFNRSGTTWSQTGGKITESGAPGGAPEFGSSVAISADGTVAIAGGLYTWVNSGNSTAEGAAWVFKYSTGSWSQQAMIRPSGYSGNTMFGISAAITPDAITSIYGGDQDSPKGASWIFTQ